MIPRPRLARLAVLVAAAAIGVPAAGVCQSPAASLAAEIEARLDDGRGAEPFTLVLARTLTPGLAAAATADVDTGRHECLVGRVLLAAGDLRGAAARFRLALRIHERAGSDAASLADALDGLAETETWFQRYASARALADRAVVLRERVVGTSASEQGAALRLARSLAVRAVIHREGGDLRAARVDVARGRAVAEAAAPAHPETARLLAAYGEQLYAEGDFGQAERVLRRAQALTDSMTRPAHPDRAAVARLLAQPLLRLGHPDEAKTLREQGLALAQEALGPDHPIVALQANDLATSLILEGDYAAARQLQRRALTIFERRLGPRQGYVATALYNLGELDTGIGDFDEAARLYRRAIAAWTSTLGPDNVYLAWPLAGLAGSLASQGRHREAVRHYERALTLRERAYGPTHERVARGLVNLSSSLLHLGRIARADTLSARALAIWEGASSPDGLAEALLVRARVEIAKGNAEAARAACERALALRLPLVGPAHPAIADAEAELAASLAALGRRDEALTAALRAEAIGRAHLRLTIEALPERQALTYASSRPRGLDQALTLLEGSAAAVLDAVVRGRALVLDEMSARQRLRAGTAGAELVPLWTRLAAARQRLANLFVRGPADADGARYAGELDRARRAKELIEAELAERSAVLGQAVARREVGLDDVRAALPARSALVSYVRYARQPSGAQAYVAFVTIAGEAAPLTIPLGPARALDEAIVAWRRQLVAGLTRAGTMPAGAERALRPVGDTLRRRLWDPIASRLTEVDRVFVVPDAAINLVPLAALPTGRGQFLVDAPLTLHYLSAERDLVGAADPEVRQGTGLLAIGGPAYGDVYGASPASSRGPDARCATLQSIAFAGLPASRREVEDVASLWRRLGGAGTPGVDASRVLTGRAASEAAFKRDSVGRLILHLATHGFFVQPRCEGAPIVGTRGAGSLRSVGGLTGASGATRTTVTSAVPVNPLVLSGLALAGANQRRSAAASVEDGILTAEEVAALDLTGTAWAVLSACDTGLGEIRSGEGVFGLRRAFQMAGARTVIMSLWAVEDQAGRDWMRALYEGRLARHLGTAEAVREASRVVLQARRVSHRDIHPFYWAGFVAAGDWR